MIGMLIIINITAPLKITYHAVGNGLEWENCSKFKFFMKSGGECMQMCISAK